MGQYKLLLALTLAVISLSPVLSEVTMEVTSDMVFSGEAATLTCTFIADNETSTFRQWKDQSGDVIGQGPGVSTTNGVQYTITDLGLSGDQIVNWQIVPGSVTSDSQFTCFVLSSAGPKEDTAKVEVVGLTPVSTVITPGESSSISCTLTGLSSSGPEVEVEWSQDSSPISGAGGSFVESTDFSGTEKVAVLTVSDITSDETYTCTFRGDTGGAVNATVTVDHVTITPSEASEVERGTRVTLSCVLQGADSAPTETKWLPSDGEAITGSEEAYTPYTSAVFEMGGQTDILIVDPVTESNSFTCCYVFSGGDCKKGVAELFVVERDVDGTGENMVDSTDDSMVDSTGDSMVDSTGDSMVNSTGDSMVDSTDDSMVDSTGDSMVDSTDDSMVDGTDDADGDEETGDGKDESPSEDNKTDSGTDDNDVDNGAMSYGRTSLGVWAYALTSFLVTKQV